MKNCCAALAETAPHFAETPRNRRRLDLLVSSRQCAPHSVASRHGTKGDVEAVRAVDRHDSQGEIDKLRLAELSPRRFINLVRHTAFGDASHGLAPSQRRALAIAVEGRLLPGVEQMKPLIAFATCMSMQWPQPLI